MIGCLCLWRKQQRAEWEILCVVCVYWKKMQNLTSRRSRWQRIGDIDWPASHVVFLLRVQSFITTLWFSLFEPKGSSTKQLSTGGKLSGDRYAAQLSSARPVVSAVIMLSKRNCLNSLECFINLLSSENKSIWWHIPTLSDSINRIAWKVLWLRPVEILFASRVKKNNGSCDFKPCNWALFFCNWDYIVQSHNTIFHSWEFAACNCFFKS